MNVTRPIEPPTTHEEAARLLVDQWREANDWPGLVWSAQNLNDEARWLAAWADLQSRLATYATTVEREALERAARIAERHDERQDFLDQGKIIAASIRAAGSGERST